jgi:ceramide glucosyltransferase
LEFVLGGLAVLSLALLVWQWTAARQFTFDSRFFMRSELPAVSVLKPLKGYDIYTKQCLRSWFLQQYKGPVEFLFGVASADDPVCAIVEKLQQDFPQVSSRLLVCAALSSTNGKAVKLAVLTSEAKHELLVISDADVSVPPDLLANLVPTLDNASVGLVNCFYRLPDTPTLAMRLEAISVNADFWSQVLQARTLGPVDFALGAVMATRKTQLAMIGGFDELTDCLADDYELGNRIAKEGYRIALSPLRVECRSPRAPWQEVWKHQLRWARTIRVCRPAPYFFSILSNATFWPALWAVIRPGERSLSILVIAFLTRMYIAYDLQSRLAGRLVAPLNGLLAPIKDLLQVGLWGASHVGDSIEWRGEKLRLKKDGTLVRQPIPKREFRGSKKFRSPSSESPSDCKIEMPG